MTLDLFSVQVITALVVNVSGILFIVETLIRRDEGAGRIWAVGFLSAMLTTLAYIVWAQTPDAWGAIAVGNAAFVAGTGCMWLGCRRFNDQRMLWPSLVVAGAVLGAALSVVIEGPAAGDWAGALWMFIPLALFAGAGAAECLRAELRRSRTALVLASVLGLQSVFYVARTAVFLAWGPESELFQRWFGTVSMSFLTVTLTIVAVVATSVLRGTRAPVRGYLRPAGAGAVRDGIVSQDAFEGSMVDLCQRATWRAELVGVIAIRIEDIEQISTAFGSDVARDVSDTWRAAVRRHAPSNALIAEDGPTGLLVGLLLDSPREARRRAAAIYRGVFDELGTVAGGVIPVVGVGVALSDEIGYSAARLTGVARDAASRAATSVETSVLVGDAH